MSVKKEERKNEEGMRTRLPIGRHPKTNHISSCGGRKGKKMNSGRTAGRESGGGVIAPRRLGSGRL